MMKTTKNYNNVAICFFSALFVLLYYGFHQPIRERDLPVVKSIDKLDECRSGNEFISVLNGGKWENTSVPLILPSDDARAVEKIDIYKLCYLRGYTDTIHWNPSCRPPQNHFFSRSANQRIPKVLLWGDSLTTQIYNECSYPNDYQKINGYCERSGIQYGRESHREMYFFPQSVPFKGRVCREEVNNSPEQYYLLKIDSEEEFIKGLVNGYDYVFFNEWAHISFLIEHLHPCYQSHKTGSPHLKEDVLQFYEDNLKHLSKLLADYSPNTKVYYRTSQPQVYRWVSQKPLKHPPTPISLNKWINSEFKYNWGSWDVMNRIAANAFLAHGHNVLDTAPAMSMRVDSHPCSYPYHTEIDPKVKVDCNHFCTPGPSLAILDAIEVEVLAREKEASTNL